MNHLNSRPRIARSFLKLAVGALALLAVLACGDSAAEPAPSPTAPSGMFSTLPTTESPLVGDQSPTIELNTLEPTSRHLPTPTPDPTSTPIPAPTPDPTGTPIPTPTPNPTATPIPAPTPDPTATPQPTYAPQPTYTPYPTYTPIPAPNPTTAPRPTHAPQPTYTPYPTYTPIPAPKSVPKLAPTPVPTATPSVPQGLSARADGETEIGLSWRRPSSDGGSRVTGYRIEVSEDGSGWSVLEADTSRTSHTHRGLTGGSTRYYRVSAITSAGEGQASNTANATTDSVDVPGAPRSLSARADGETEIGLSWNRPSSDGGSRVTGYRIDVSEDGSGWSVLETDTGFTRTSYTHRGLTAGSTRYYRVSAINSAGTGPPSNTANATTDSVDVPGAPRSLSARADGETEIGLSWSRPSSDGGSRITGYRIEVSEDGSGWSVLETDTGFTRTSYTHRGLTGGSTRYYRVSAINSAGEGQASNTANATTETPIPCEGYKDDLFGTIRHGDPGIVQCVIDEGADVDEKNSFGDPPLQKAIENGSDAIVRILVNAKANVNAKDGFENPMLHEAIERGKVEIVRILVVEGNADVDAKDRFGDPMLHEAIERGEVQIVSILVAGGNADVNATDRFDISPLTKAKEKGNAQIIEILEDAGATE